MITIDTDDLTLDDFMNVIIHHHKVQLGPNAINKIEAARKVVDTMSMNDAAVYGINTGFGSLSTIKMNSNDCIQLQYNLIRSCAVGVGEACPPWVARGMFLLRLKCITNGNSGIRLCIAEKIVEALNKNYIPYIPCQGSVGASGDLCPLSHLFLGLLGEGKALNNTNNTTNNNNNTNNNTTNNNTYTTNSTNYISAKDVMNTLDITPITLDTKEGLGLTNGTQYITTWTAYSTYHALRIMNLSSIIAATSIEALHGIPNAFDPRIHAVKPHTGQIEVAKQIRSILQNKNNNDENININENNNINNCVKVQDAYSLRCIPQVHGAVYDLIKFVEKHVLVEMNCSNDNPLILGSNVVSGGNFHGMYIGMAADQLAYAFSILCNISERRVERMVNADLNKLFPPFLTPNPGLHSGFMLIQYTSAAITAENRQLANPGSVDNINTCAGFEDIVSMAAWPVRKAYQSMENTYKVLALELFTANQALHFSKLNTNITTNHIINHLRSTIPFITSDVYMGDYIEQVISFVKSPKIFEFSNLD